MKTYHSNETVKARQVTDEDGENVVTATGVQHVAQDWWIVEPDQGGGTHAMDNDTFCERYFEPVKADKPAAKKTASKPAAKKTASGQTAAERLKAAKAGK